MSVIATDESDQLANYSNYGLHNTDIAAPGSKILSTVLNGQVSSDKAVTSSHKFCCPCAMYTRMLEHAVCTVRNHMGNDLCRTEMHFGL